MSYNNTLEFSLLEIMLGISLIIVLYLSPTTIAMNSELSQGIYDKLKADAFENRFKIHILKPYSLKQQMFSKRQQGNVLKTIVNFHKLRDIKKEVEKRREFAVETVKRFGREDLPRLSLDNTEGKFCYLLHFIFMYLFILF